jgi:hypothetical protein
LTDFFHSIQQSNDNKYNLGEVAMMKGFITLK